MPGSILKHLKTPRGRDGTARIPPPPSHCNQTSGGASLLTSTVMRDVVVVASQVMARLVDARAPLLPLGHKAGLAFCNAYGDWRRAMVLMEDMRVAKRRPSGENERTTPCVQGNE